METFENNAGGLLRSIILSKKGDNASGILTCISPESINVAKIADIVSQLNEAAYDTWHDDPKVNRWAKVRDHLASGQYFADSRPYFRIGNAFSVENGGVGFKISVSGGTEERVMATVAKMPELVEDPEKLVAKGRQIGK